MSLYDRIIISFSVCLLVVAFSACGDDGVIVQFEDAQDNNQADAATGRDVATADRTSDTAGDSSPTDAGDSTTTDTATDAASDLASDQGNSDAGDTGTEPTEYGYNLCGAGFDETREGGTWEAPVEVPYLPFVDDHTTIGGSDVVNSYDCSSSTGENGPEVVYAFSSEHAGTFRAELTNPEGVDIDLHLLRNHTVNAGRASGCLGRAHEALEVADLPAGDYLLVADSWTNNSGTEFPGAFQVAFDWIADDEWTHTPVREGVTWSRLRASDLAGGDQTVNALRIDLTSGHELHLQAHDGCERVADVGGDIGAFAGINTSFFDGSCDPIVLFKSDGELIGTNTMGEQQRSLGWTAMSDVRMDWIARGADWPAVDNAVAGAFSLVRGGVAGPETGPDIAATSSLATAQHPRTALGLTAEGELLLVTVDGRTAAGDGMSGPQLAELMVELGATEAINLDGGGSTTMYVEDCWFGHVVNNPSDGSGPRSVADGLYLR